jgi:hypothetical protein
MLDQADDHLIADALGVPEVGPSALSPSHP